MSINETGALGLTPNAPREKPPSTPSRVPENDSQANSTRPRWRLLRDLRRDEPLGTFLDLGARP